MDSAPIALDERTILAERPFTHPRWTAADGRAMERMAARVRELVLRERPRVKGRRLDLFYLEEAEGRSHRVVIAHWDALRRGASLMVVGFFGQRRPGADELEVHMADSVLLQEFVDHPDLLSYSSLQLAHGQWGNLVLFRRVEGLQHWNRSPFHARVAAEISPRYYRSIRLHNGRLPGGLFGGAPIRIVQTKYYDFAGPEGAPGHCWRAVRTYQGPTLSR